MFTGVFSQAFIYLLAAVLAVPLAKRLGLGSALGYLLAGVAIGPFVFGFIGPEGQDVMHFAEFGVVLMIGGNIPGETQVLSIALYDYVESLQFAEAHRLAGGLVVFSLVLLFLLYRRDRQESWRVHA